MKKENFQKIKKNGEEYFRVPKEVQIATGICGLTEDGIGMYASGRFDKVYSCSENKENVSNYEKVKGCTMLLRGTEINFCFYELPDREEKILLLLSLEAKTVSDAQKAFSLLEQELQGNLYTFGITIRPLSAEEKLYLMHQLIMADLQGARMDITQYVAKVSGWLPDFKLQHYTEEENWIRTKDKYCSVMYIRQMPTEHAATIYRKIKKMSGCRMVVTTYQPISEEEVMKQIEKNYFGYDSVLYTLTRKQLGIGKIVAEQKERRYVYAGVYFMFSEEKKEELIASKKELQEFLTQYRCDMAEYPFYQKQSAQQLFTLNPFGMKQTRLLQVNHVVAMNPFYQEDRIIPEEEVDAKAELLLAFDKFYKKGDLDGTN